METLSLHITINSKLYKKNPESSDLGRRILCNSIVMINEMGFESFTFKKLGEKIDSNESSVYRYFDSKHSLLIYLVNWYWSWFEYRLVFNLQNIKSPEKRLKRSIKLLTQAVRKDDTITFINEKILHKIIVSESSKAYHTKYVDEENEKGFFSSYKSVVQRVSDIVLECNPCFEFPHMLVSTVIEGAHQQRYFSKHLPSLTDFEKGKDNIVRFYIDMVFKTLGI